MVYMAPEIINGEKYNNKVDLWSLGCIIHELCTLNYCFNSDTNSGLIKNISKSNHEKIKKEIYSEKLQELIDKLLNVEYQKRPDIEQIINFVKKCMNNVNIESMTIILEKDESYQNYMIEKSIQFSLDQIHLNILKREYKYSIIKEKLSYISITMPLKFIVFTLITGGLGTAIGIGVSLISIIATSLIVRKVEKQVFIIENIDIIKYIENKITESIIKRIKEKILIQSIIVYNKNNFEEKIKIIKNRLISPKHITKLKQIITKNLIFC